MRFPYASGIILVIAGMFMAFILHQAHYYSLFSLGVLIILLRVHDKIAKKSLFHSWKKKNYIAFFILMLASSVAIDLLGISLGFWTYPSYTSLTDNILKYVFEWIIPMTYIMLSLLIGKEILAKYRIKSWPSWIISLAVFVTITGIITEYINHVAGYSWKVLSMPITNYMIGNYFLIFQTIGYWSMALVTLICYKLAEDMV